MSAARVYCALLHYPVQDRAGQTVTTAVTNLDVHDIARTARTFGVRRYYVVTPIEAQHVLVQRIIDHWTRGRAQAHPGAARGARAVRIDGDAGSRDRRHHRARGRSAEAGRHGRAATTGRALATFPEVRAELARGNRIPFDTVRHRPRAGRQRAEMADVLLEPIAGASDYNHLSVRAAAAIALDRLLRLSPGLARNAR